MTEEQKRLDSQREKRENWRLWGPYLAERAWATVREDYSADGASIMKVSISCSNRPTDCAK